MDIITGFSADEELKKFLHKKKLLVQLLLAFFIIYTVIDLFYWIPYLNISSNGAYVRRNFFYYYRYLPLEAMIRLLVYVISYVIALKAVNLQVAGVENKDSFSFNKGVRFFNISLLISVLFSAVGILQAVYRTFLLK